MPPLQSLENWHFFFGHFSTLVFPSPCQTVVVDQVQLSAYIFLPEISRKLWHLRIAALMSLNRLFLCPDKDNLYWVSLYIDTLRLNMKITIRTRMISPMPKGCLLVTRISLSCLSWEKIETLIWIYHAGTISDFCLVKTLLHNFKFHFDVENLCSQSRDKKGALLILVSDNLDEGGDDDDIEKQCSPSRDKIGAVGYC